MIFKSLPFYKTFILLPKQFFRKHFIIIIFIDKLMMTHNSNIQLFYRLKSITILFLF